MRCSRWRITFAGKSRCRFKPGADGCSAEREFLQNGDRLFRALFRISDLLRVTAEFLAEPDRRRIHQMGATDLDDVLRILSLSLRARRAVFRAPG